MIPDVNLLVSASLRAHPHHALAHARLMGAMGRDAASPLQLPVAVLAGFVRVVTNTRAIDGALQPEQAMQFTHALLSSPGARLLEDAGAWPVFGQLCVGLRIGGPLVPDAWLAACTLHHRERLATFDRDFVRLLPPQNLELLSAA